MTVPQAERAGRDAARSRRCAWNAEREHYDFGEIDWSELKRVIAGDGR
jgi:ring-1,2-phenylacetyl-CoA epoxidase subunit PaaA